jgi:hypothetical protein
MGISVKKIAPTNEAERMHENDYQTAKQWWGYISRQLQHDLAPVRPEIRFMSRSEALKELGDRVQRTKTTISLFGISIDEKLAAIAAPASLFLIILYLYFHVLHLYNLDSMDHTLLAEYPWAPLFVGLKGTVSTSVMLLGLPVIALAVFCVRVWRSGLLSSGGSSIPGCEALVIAAATIAVCGALTLALNKLRRLSSSNPAVTERAATAPAAES